MFKYFKIRISVLLFLSVFLSVGSIVLSINVKNNGPLGAFIFVALMIIFIIKYFRQNFVFSMYDKAMQQKNYVKADEIATKYMNKYKGWAVLKVNLFLIRGENELYLYHYNNFSVDLNKKKWRYYQLVFQAFKIYYDLISNNKLDFDKAQNIKGISEHYSVKVCCNAIELVAKEEYEKALKLMRQNILSGGDFSQYIYAYVNFLCIKGLGYDTAEHITILKKLAYNDYLIEITNKFIK